VPKGKAPGFFNPGTKSNGTRRILVAKDVDGAKRILALGYHANEPERDDRRYAMKLLSVILGEKHEFRGYFQQLRETFTLTATLGS